ncbi:hypothetical protein Tco_0711294, partial [Tanacetum coccineum]
VTTAPTTAPEALQQSNSKE